MKLSDVNPHIRYAATHRIALQTKMDSICYDCRLFYIRDGSGHITANGQSHSFTAHSAFFFPPGTRYRFYMGKGQSRIALTVIDFDLINDYHHLSRSLGTASEFNYDPAKRIPYELPDAFSDIIAKSTPSLADPLKRITTEFLTQDTLYRETASALLKLCLMDLIRNYSKDSDAQKTAPVLDYIHKNYHDTGLTNQTVAAAFNYHPYYLSQLIKDYTGKTLHQYLTDYRLKIAKKNLLTTDDSIDTVAWKSGFLSSAYFIKVFKTRFGVTPGKYRKTNMQQLL